VPEGVPAVEAQPVQVATGGCSYAHFHARALATVRGVVVTDRGEPADGLDVERSPLGIELDRNVDRAWVNEQGEYRFENLMPGEYRLVINPHNRPDTYPTVYYPGALEAQGAQSFLVTDGEEVDLGLLQLPPARQKVALRGQVLRPDGAPVPRIDLRIVTVPDGRYVAHAQTDEQGQFTAEVHAGFEVRVVFASEPAPWTKGGVIVTASEDLEPLRLILEGAYYPPPSR
jgi:hypothetical protein